MEEAFTLLQLAEKTDLIAVLSTVFGDGVRVRLPLTQEVCAMRIEDLGLSVRSSNALRRDECSTVGAVADLIESGQLTQLHSLGKKSAGEIKSVLLALGYAHLSEKQRLQFWQDVLEVNA